MQTGSSELSAAVSCFLRMLYALLTVPCSQQLKEQTAHWLRLRVTMQRMIRVLGALPSLLDYCLAQKFLHVVFLAWRGHGVEFGGLLSAGSASGTIRGPDIKLHVFSTNAAKLVGRVEAARRPGRGDPQSDNLSTSIMDS